MIRASLALLCVSCTAQDAMPDEFHLFGTSGAGGSTGWVEQTGSNPYRARSESDGDFWAVTAGFTWAIGAPTPTSNDWPMSIDPPPIKLDEEQFAALTNKNTPPPDGVYPVRVEGATDHVLLKLVGSLTILITALATYLGRERIPVVREARAKYRAWREDHNSAEPPPDGD